MFQVRIAQLGEFRKTIELIRDITTEVIFEMNENGLDIRANDPINIAQIIVHFSPAYFEEFKVSAAASIGIPLEPFANLLKLNDPEDSIILQFSDRPVLYLIVESKKIPKLIEFSMNLIYVEQPDFTIENIEYPNRIVINSKEIHSLFTDLSYISDFIVISLTRTRLKMTINSDLGDGRINFKHKASSEGVFIQCTQDFILSLNLFYLKKITKASSLSDRVEISLIKTRPVKLRYAFTEGSITYYLAPAIDE